MRRPAHEPDPVDGPVPDRLLVATVPWVVPDAAVAPPGPVQHAATPPGAGPHGAALRGGAEPATAGGGLHGRRSGHPAPDATGADSEVHRRATALVRTMVEVLAGRRAPAHLSTVATPEVVRYVAASRTTGDGAPAAPRRVHVSRPGPDAAEVVAVCRFGARSRALAVRLEREPPPRSAAVARDGGPADATARPAVWRATAVRLL